MKNMKNIKNIVTAIAVLASVTTTGIASTEGADDYSLQFTIVNNLDSYSKNPLKANIYFETISDGNCFTINRSIVKLKSGDSKSITVRCKNEESSYQLVFTYNTLPGGPGNTTLTVSPSNNSVTNIDGNNLSSVTNGDVLTNGMRIEFNNTM